MDKYQILKQYFGYDEFREGQEQLIDSLLAGRDVLGVMPTGAGKSLCYQIPALMADGITLVISPLISLMKDQVGALNQVGVHAAYLNSSLSASQYYKALDLARQGRYPIIYVAPERLLTEEFMDFAAYAKIAMVAVDEAHCVSQWGQDFRPSYLRIVEFIESLPVRPVVGAFTATATSEVRDDIIDILMLQEPVVMSTGFDRPNLYFGVQSPKDKYETMTNYISLHPGESGIVYCLTRKTVEEVCGKLAGDGYSVTRYHAGLGDAERQRNQDDFIYDRSQIMVATNAFGMGIDKSNVRYVIHYNMPKNMESYYQEAGRAGRDGEPAECILLYGGQDVVMNQFFIDHNVDNQELDMMTRAVVQERDRQRLRKMTFYCFTNECLRDYILRYFGEYGSNYCGNCSNCFSQFENVDVTEIARALIGCVGSCRQRYGANVIIDTVHGANTAKIRQYRMDECPQYAALSKVPTYKLRQVMNYLQLNEYLAVTSDEYSIVKLTERSKTVLEGQETVVMKMTKEIEHPAKVKSDRNRKSGKGLASGLTDAPFSESEERLFEKLRQLRTEIAREEKVPPYIVFSDKTLTHMCLVKPRSKKEMLSVSGVGEFKYDKYGERFLTCVKEEWGPEDAAAGESARAGEAPVYGADLPAKGEMEEIPYDEQDAMYFLDESGDDEDYNLDTVLTAWESGGRERPDIREDQRDDVIQRTVAWERNTASDESSLGRPYAEISTPKKKKATKSKAEFVMDDELAEQIHYSERVTLSDFVGQINDLRDEEVMKRLTIKSVEQMLLDKGLLELRFVNRMPLKSLTEKGREFGIDAETRVSEKGNEYEVFYYQEAAQRGMVEWLFAR